MTTTASECPPCPKHGLGGAEAAKTVRASSIRDGSNGQPPRQRFRCRFELVNGEVGEHRYRGEPIPRLIAPSALCPDCGQPIEDWRGERVFPNYHFTAEPIADALAQIATGASYRQAAQNLRLLTGATSGSKEASVMQRLTEVLAPILHQALVPQTWPDGGLLAVDAVRFNLLGRHKHEEATAELSVEHAIGDLLDMLDPDEAEDQEARLELEKFLPPDQVARTGLQGGVPNWQILGAYGYPINSEGAIPRGAGAGKPWLFRAYRGGDALTWAHFFRQLPGTPAYVLSDMAPAIGLGVELAWPDPATRPELLICEYHATEVIKSRLPDDSRLQDEVKRLFLTHGRWVNGTYHPDVPNGDVGSIMRLRHFATFRRLARQAEIFDFDRLFATPTWHRVMAQVVNKDWKLRYSTGALETQLYQLGQRHIGWRAGRMTNRARTDALLMLLHLGMLQQASSSNFLHVVEHWLRHHPSLPRQLRQTDTKGAVPSLRRPLTDAELQAAGLMTNGQFEGWKTRRRNRLMHLRRERKIKKDPGLRKAANRKRVERRRRNDPENLARKRWYQEHRQEEIQKATERKAAAKALAQVPPVGIIEGEPK